MGEQKARRQSGKNTWSTANSFANLASTRCIDRQSSGRSYFPFRESSHTRRSLFPRRRSKSFLRHASEGSQGARPPFASAARVVRRLAATSTGRRPVDHPRHRRRSRVKISLWYSQYRLLQDEHVVLLVCTQLITPPTRQDRRDCATPSRRCWPRAACVALASQALARVRVSPAARSRRSKRCATASLEVEPIVLFAFVFPFTARKGVFIREDLEEEKEIAQGFELTARDRDRRLFEF